MNDVIRALTEALGPDAVLTGDQVHQRQAGIWRRDTILAKALVRARSTEDVSRAMRICWQHDQTVVAHGGLTGLVNGALTGPDDVVISLERMNAIENIDPVNRTMLVQAGAVLQQIQERAEEAGLMFPLDLGGRGSATIGGNISTNAGGNRVIRYGMTRDMVLGLEAVLPDGTVLSSLNQMIKNNAGYDLKQLFIGSEGTLGIVTRAVLRLRERPKHQATLFVAVDGFQRLPAFLKHMDAALGGTLSAFEVMWNEFYRLVTTAPAQNQPPLPQDYPYYVLVEAMGADDAAVEAALADAYEQALIVDAVLAQSESQRRQLWAMRDDVAQCFRDGPTIGFDVSLKVSDMEAYVAEVRSALAAALGPHRCYVFGHLGDGNLHVVVGVDKVTPEVRHRVEECVYRPLAGVGGSVSAEHGIGLEKKAYLSISRSPVEVALMRTLKRAIDPKGLLNPNKIFDLDPASGEEAA
ncbi:MAG TPA: FAD-binding oxidoreductase [Pseudomonadales bacterium]